ncbi:TIM barrel protein, partial [Klebsiella pneumoniae]
VKKIHVTAGILHKNEHRATALATFANNVKKVAKEAASEGITILLEPINHRNMPNYLISNIDEVADIIYGIAEDNVKLMFDVY